MCGIAGIVKFRQQVAPWHAPRLDFSGLTAMAEAIAHRGPDGAGQFVDPRPDKTAALLHARLAIIDRQGGHQPMPNEDGTVHVTFNGEIYNHAELRQELLAQGHRFQSDHSDTEVLVHGWEQWGENLPGKLRGMFAFAIWDTRLDAAGKPRDTLFLARDRMGQKPLFYATLDDGIVFGSTIPSVLAWPEVPRRVPREQIALYLQYGYIPAPQTIFRDISALSPGHYLRLRRDVLDGASYWQPPQPGPQNARRDLYAAATELRAKLSQAVESQLIADVPIACFLSGGIDSSIIAALMQKAVLGRGGPRIRTVSVGFAESAFDETAFAAAVAKKIGSQHTRLEVNAAHDILATLQTLMQTCLGQPFADSSIIPTYHLSKAVRSIAPVALSGDGADELFAGYDRYRAMTLLARWPRLSRFMPRAMPLSSLPRRERFRRLANAARESDTTTRYTRLLEIFPTETIEALMGELPTPPNSELRTLNSELLSPLRLAMLRDQRDYLPNDVLWKVDSASMSPGPINALEVRAPFLDHTIVEFANALDDSPLIQGGGPGGGKTILRQTFHNELPPLVRTRAKKGFSVPIGTWFNTTLKETLTNLLTAKTSFTQQHLHTPTIQKLLTEHHNNTRDHTHRLFSLLMLELFWSTFKPTLDA